MDLILTNRKLTFILFILMLSKIGFSKIQVSSKEKGEEFFLLHEPKLKAKKENDSTLSKQNDPGVFYRGNEMATFLKKNYGHLKGDVLIEHLEITLETPEAYIYFDENKTVYKIQTFNPTSIIKLKTEDSDEMKGFCETSFYYPLERKISLKGNVKIIRPEEVIEGDHIDYYLETEELRGKGISGFLKSKNKKKSS